MRLVTSVINVARILMILGCYRYIPGNISQYCGTTFTHTRSLVGHKKRYDLKPGGKPPKEFKCEDCRTQCYQKKDLSKHRL